MGSRDEGIALERGRARGGYTPHYMHEFENKRVAEWVPGKCMKRKGRFFLG